ncbi:dimethylsulfonioproprionate lyase family protein [Sedimentitalea nanhaiensis]|uniref:Dimethlysulfonioproprionate lyase n=1 Tax=Sedimentitalea nanhaiensis TaxID=999627 RepID=A0A1I7D3K0_9RHOB|nr:dimethylsulfonioproprionate lyase family protein [Sedimentitalea nanhaiensis]SFU06164.1 Dimethlysulfonioproprionate lyase [Sedimentitalea nanhaiensis]
MSGARRLRLQALLDALVARLQVHDSAIAGQLRREVLRLDISGPMPDPVWMDTCDLLPDLVAQMRDDLSAPLSAAVRDLFWRRPGFGRLPASLTDNMAVTEILGPDGMFAARNLRFGLLLQGPWVSYPSHRHAAGELYHILRGQAEWQVGVGPARLQEAGAFIHHLPGQPHGMRTGAGGMLALWGWTGDLGADSYAV